ncbi:MAG TPA: VWA domain-containing protein [Pyrinomonadaceae bacterium]|nr:VWA domain-containing protein [Pyrinomonadaceae bacterium]
MTLPHPVRSRRHVSRRAARSKFLFSTFALSFAVLLAAQVRAQTTPPTTDAPVDDEILRVNTDLVTVPVVVTDGRGRRQANLTLQDFEVRHGERLVKLDYFSTGAERVRMLFALDTSGSARQHIARQTEAALAMFTRFGRNSRIAVLAFADQAQLALPFTADIERARTAFQLDARPNRPTAIFDAASAAVRAFDAAGSEARERRIVLLFSDGLDTASRTPPASVVADARLRGVSIYVIHFPLFTPRDGQLVLRRPAKGFRELAEQTGGHYFQLGDARAALDPRASHDLAPIFRAITEDLQSQYILGYYLDAATRSHNNQRLQVTLTPQHRRLRVRLLRENTVQKTVTSDK